MANTVYIVSAQRTAVGSFQGQFANTPATQLGSAAITAAVKSSTIEPSNIEECIMGHVLTSGCGQAPARQAALGAGLPHSTPCLTINKVCGSGLKAVMLAADAIHLGHSDIIVAGGQENMTLAPHILPKSRNGYRMGNIDLLDAMIHDGLWDPSNNWHMGCAAELCAKEYKFSRAEQDEFAIASYKKAQSAQAAGAFNSEITPVEVKTRKTSLSIDTDEEPARALFEKMPSLRPAFEKEGTITAANASKINDGAAALVLASEAAVKKFALAPLAKIVSQGSFAHDPKWFTTAPVTAIKKSLEKAKLKASDIDLYEINEAFSVVTMAAIKDLNLDANKVNINGGAVAIGHPIGASGARIFTTLVHALKKNNKSLGLASLCIGGGEAVSVIIQRV